jgi:hypothetical protein
LGWNNIRISYGEEKRRLLSQSDYIPSKLWWGGGGVGNLCAGMNTDFNNIKVPVLNLKF